VKVAKRLPRGKKIGKRVYEGKSRAGKKKSRGGVPANPIQTPRRKNGKLEMDTIT